MKRTATQKIRKNLGDPGRRFEGAPVGLCSFDTELRYVQINGFLAAINGRPIEEHLGKSVSQVLPEVAAAGVEAQLRRVIESGEPIVQGTVTTETPAHPGEERTYLHNYSAIRSGDGAIIGVACSIVDITNAKVPEGGAFGRRLE